MKKTIVLLILGLILSSCGGGGDDNGGDGKNLSKSPNLKTLFDQIQKEKIKDDFESTSDYQNRLYSFSQSLTGYHATVEVHTSYDADLEELYLEFFPNSIGEGEKDYQTAFYSGYTELNIENANDVYVGEYREEIGFNGEPYDRKYYAILQMTPEEAKKIIGGFRVDLTFTFTSNQISESERNCVSAYFTNCTNNIYASIDDYRVYNIVDNQEY